MIPNSYYCEVGMSELYSVHKSDTLPAFGPRLPSCMAGPDPIMLLQVASNALTKKETRRPGHSRNAGERLKQG